jgi:hypothetical protein
VQLCLLRFPGQGLLPDASMPMSLLQWIGRQLRINPSCWPQYAEREETRREHLLDLRAYLGVEPFGLAHYRQTVHVTTELALQTDKGNLLAVSVLDTLRLRHISLYGRIGQALIDAKQSGRDPFAAIEAVMSWDAFAESVTEAQKLAQPEDFDFLHRIGESYATLRRYAPEFLAVLKLRAAPAAKNVLDAIEVLRG